MNRSGRGARAYGWDEWVRIIAVFRKVGGARISLHFGLKHHGFSTASKSQPFFIIPFVPSFKKSDLQSCSISWAVYMLDVPNLENGPQTQCWFEYHCRGFFRSLKSKAFEPILFRLSSMDVPLGSVMQFERITAVSVVVCSILLLSKFCRFHVCYCLAWVQAFLAHLIDYFDLRL